MMIRTQLAEPPFRIHGRERSNEQTIHNAYGHADIDSRFGLLWLTHLQRRCDAQAIAARGFYESAANDAAKSFARPIDR